MEKNQRIQRLILCVLAATPRRASSVRNRSTFFSEDRPAGYFRTASISDFHHIP